MLRFTHTIEHFALSRSFLLHDFLATLSANFGVCFCWLSFALPLSITFSFSVYCLLQVRATFSLYVSMRMRRINHISPKCMTIQYIATCLSNNLTSRSLRGVSLRQHGIAIVQHSGIAIFHSEILSPILYEMKVIYHYYATIYTTILYILVFGSMTLSPVAVITSDCMEQLFPFGILPSIWY